MMRNPLARLFDNRRSQTIADLLAAYLRDTPGSGRLTDDGALRVGTFNACLRLVSGVEASLPLHVYRRRDDGGKERQVLNSLDQLLSVRPNPWQTAFEWREQQTGHLILRGNAYSWINWVEVVDRTGARRNRAVELVPLHPDLVDVQQSAWNQPPSYWLKRKDGTKVPLPAEEVLHVRGFSTNGVMGRSLVSDARETVGVALDTQRFASRLFTNDATPGVVLKHPARLKDDTARRLREQWDDIHAGNVRRTAVLEDGMTLEKLTLNPDDAQFLQTRDMQRSEICGLFPVPPHLVGIVDKSTSWGTGIEQQNIQFLTYCIGILNRRWEAAIRRCLIEADETFFVEHVTEGLLRSDIKSRYGAYAVGRQWGWLSVNDIRARENLNPIGPEGDVYLQPLNMVEAGVPPAHDDVVPDDGADGAGERL